MKIEKFIKNISAITAALAVYFMSAGFYLSAKGFVLNAEGNLVLMKHAQAAESAPRLQNMKIPANYVMPEGAVLGSANAPVSVYEFSSFGCYHCADFHLETLPKLKKDFIDTGAVKLVFVPFPIDRSSMNGALLAKCMPENRYFAFADLLFKKQREWGLSRNPDKVLLQYAALNGLSAEKAKACLKNDENAREILAARQDGMSQLGIQGTPSFVIKSKDGFQLLPGVQSYDDFKEILQQKLAKK